MCILSTQNTRHVALHYNELPTVAVVGVLTTVACEVRLTLIKLYVFDWSRGFHRVPSHHVVVH